MLFPLFVFALLTTAKEDNRFSGVATQLPALSSRHSSATPLGDVPSSQLSGENGANKGNLGAVKHKHFKGLALIPHEWAGLWPGGEVPYKIVPTYTFEELRLIRWAMDAFRKHTCIRFRHRTQSDMYYLSITKLNTGCHSHIGRAAVDDEYRTREGKFETPLNFDSTCFCRRAVLHELMHAIGFHHEHQREDRDPRINASAQPSSWQYRILSRTDANYMGKYDPESVMHYAFPELKDYNREYFSQSDIDNINKLYKCHV